MSIEGARDQILSAREKLVEARSDVERGRENSEDVLTNYAAVADRNAELAGEGARLASMIEQTKAATVDFRSNIGQAADLEYDVLDAASLGRHHFTRAGLHAVEAHTELTATLGQEDADAYVNPCIDHTDLASSHASATASRAGAAEERLRAYMDQLGGLVHRLGEMVIEVDALAHGVSHVHQTRGIDPERAMPIVSLDELQRQAADDPASFHEQGAAASEAFNRAIQAVNGRLENL